MCDVARTRVPLRGSFLSATEMAILFGELDLESQLDYRYWIDLVKQAVDAVSYTHLTLPTIYSV